MHSYVYALWKKPNWTSASCGPECDICHLQSTSFIASHFNGLFRNADARMEWFLWKHSSQIEECCVLKLRLKINDWRRKGGPIRIVGSRKGCVGCGQQHALWNEANVSHRSIFLAINFRYRPRRYPIRFTAILDFEKSSQDDSLKIFNNWRSNIRVGSVAFPTGNQIEAFVIQWSSGWRPHRHKLMLFYGASKKMVLLSIWNVIQFNSISFRCQSLYRINLKVTIKYQISPYSANNYLRKFLPSTYKKNRRDTHFFIFAPFSILHSLHPGTKAFCKTNVPCYHDVRMY